MQKRYLYTGRWTSKGVKLDTGYRIQFTEGIGIVTSEREAELVEKSGAFKRGEIVVIGGEIPFKQRTPTATEAVSTRTQVQPESESKKTKKVTKKEEPKNENS